MHFLDTFINPSNPDFEAGAYFCWQIVCTKAFVASSERVTGLVFVGTGGRDYLVGADLKIQRIDASGYEVASSLVENEIGAGLGVYLPWTHYSGSTLLDYANPRFSIVCNDRNLRHLDELLLDSPIERDE
jgi:hypothetical protein